MHSAGGNRQKKEEDDKSFHPHADWKANMEICKKAQEKMRKHPRFIDNLDPHDYVLHGGFNCYFENIKTDEGEIPHLFWLIKKAGMENKSSGNKAFPLNVHMDIEEFKELTKKAFK